MLSRCTTLARKELTEIAIVQRRRRPQHGRTASGGGDYQNGIALANPKANGVKTVTVEAGFHRIDGDQAPSVNNGLPAASITLQDRDGIILLRD